jgi:hypothetical protein
MLTLWEWQSGIPLPSIITGGSPLTNTTTTNATADTNATAASEEEGEQQQTTIMPASLLK